MDGQRYGVIVGVTAGGPGPHPSSPGFAEQAARQFSDRLTDPATGAFDSARVCLLTGAAATTRAVKAALRDAALALSPSDVLLVYFAGPVFLSPWLRYNDPYLVTADLDPGALRADPDDGLRLSFLRRDVLEAAQGSSYLILDTSQDGVRARPPGPDAAWPAAAFGHALEDLRAAHSGTRDALFCCAPDGSAPDGPAPDGAAPDGSAAGGSAPDGAAPDGSAPGAGGPRAGTLTRVLLRGLAGAAAGQDGQVSFEALAGYARGAAREWWPGTPGRPGPPDPWPASAPWSAPAAGRPGPLAAELVLTRPAAPRPAAPPPATDQPQALVTAIETLANPLDIHLDSLQLLLDRTFRPGRELAASLASPDHDLRLETLRQATDAVAAAEVCLTDGKVIASAGACPGGQVLDGATRERMAGGSGNKSVLGYNYLDSGDSHPHQLIVFLHQLAQPEIVLVLTEPAPCFARIGEPLAVVLRALWDLPPGNDRLEAEVLVLSALRTSFGRLPAPLYLSCLNTYSQLLNSLVMVFEPVMILSAVPELVGIQSWEALARRDMLARRAPAATLAIPDKWGDRFVIERDTVLAGKAIASYARAHAAGPWHHQSPKPVSINVSVRSLLSEVYEQALAQSISDAGLAPHTVTLEISERDAIEPHPDEAEHWQPTPIAYFQARLHDLARSLQVNFAVDDFGVGHASLDRVSSLDLTQIKVDRSILHHSLALGELELVVQLARESWHSGSSATPRAVVVEGFDAESPVSLRELYERGIRYVQGYITEEPASPHLRPLNEDVCRRVAALVSG